MDDTREENQIHIKEENNDSLNLTESDEHKENPIKTEQTSKDPFINSELQKYEGKYTVHLSKIEKLQVPIIESFNLELLDNFKYYSSRFYTDKYSVDFQNLIKEMKGEFHDILVRIHTNGVLLIALAPGNSIMQSSKEISEINFKINNTDRSNINIRGKRKLGAKFVKKETMVCQVKLEGDPTYYSIRAGVQGLLVEFNKLIKTKPNIIKTDPKGLGYICMILPKAPKDKMTEAINSFDLLCEDDYFEYISTRQKGKFWKTETQ